MSELARTPRRRGLSRRAGSWLLGAGAALFAYLYVVPLLRRWDVPEVLSVAIAVPVVGTLMLPMTLLVAAGRTTDYSLNRLARPALVATGCAASVAIGDVLIDASGTSPPLGSLASWTIVTCAVIWTATFQHAREARRALTQRVLEAEHPDHAAELASRCRAELGDESLEPDARVLLTLNLAGALISLSSRADQEDALPEALALLEGAARTSPPALAFTAAGQLVAAMEVKAERSGDEVGYERALELLTETAERASATVPDAPGRALAARAEWYAQRAGREPRPEEAARLHALALAEQRRAVAATPPGAESHAPREAALTRLAAAYPLHDDLDSAISDCRASLRPLRSSGDPERAATMLALADLLELRAILEPEGGIGKMLDKLWPGRPRTGVVDYLWPDRATHDVMRAMVLCIRAGFGGGSSAEAAERLPRLRDLLIKTSRTWLPSASERQTGWMYSLVVREHARRSGSAAAAVAARWAGWASERGDDQQAAKAWWCWVTSISADLQRRVLRDKEHRISNIQGVIVQAADALVRAGRLRDGAVALELGRAILLTERMERDRDDIPLRLLASGHPELADRWRESSRLVQRADREAFERTGATSPDEPALASAEYLALTGFDRLVREIGRLPGYEDVHALPDYEDLREAVSEGPLVYLAAAAGGGFALIVTAAAEPVLVELPRLDRDSVAAQARTLLAATRGQELLRAMDALLPRLRADVVAPLAAHLPQDSLVTLVPVGALSELPIHVAGLEPGADGVWRDATGGIVFRYAPNARVLARAQRTAEALSGAEPRLLTAAVPSASGLPRLDRAIAESDGVARGFPGPAEQPRPATVEAVRSRLDRCSIWHFACHGVHDAASPLDSTLELADGALTLRAVFASGSATRRLAVLSACESGAVDPALLDEVVGFPAAMLQSGVAGVVSCHAAVEDEAATLLVLGFFARLWRAGSPARALAEAQAWLRGATNAEIAAEFPTVHLPPDDELPDLSRWRAHRPYADPWTWALFSYTGA